MKEEEFVFEEDAFPVLCVKDVPIDEGELQRAMSKAIILQDKWAEQECWYAKVLLFKCLDKKSGMMKYFACDTKELSDCKKYYKQLKTEKNTRWQLEIRKTCLVKRRT